MNYKNFKIERRGAIAIVTFNRPDKANAINVETMQEIEAFADAFRDDLETRVVVITGEGKHFSSGADLTDPGRAKSAELSTLARIRNAHLGQRIIGKLQAMNQITIAAINGAAMGGGACVATALDFRIGADDCFVSYPEINLGMTLSWYGLPLCVRIVGPAKAKRLVILGQKEKAETLLEWGFLDEVVPRAQLMDRALELAEHYAAQPPIPAQMIKRSVNAIASALDQSIMHMDADQLLFTTQTDDYLEGIQAYLEKRDGQFKGA